MNFIEKLREKLNNVSDTYPEFVRGILEDCEYYKDKNPHIAEEVLQYIDENPKADTSDITDFELYCIGIPWGDENGKWYRWDKEITEEEAKRITQEEYCDD